MEGAQVFQLFPNADKPNRQACAFGQGKQDTAFGGAVELGECQPGHARSIAELFSLVDGILSGARIQHQQYLVGCVRDQLLHYPGDFGEFVHQVATGVQAPGGIGDQDVGAAGLCRLDRVIHHRGRIGTGVLGHHGNVVALAPYLQLLYGGGPEGIASGQHHALAFGFEAAGQFADGGGLADPVHADHQDYVGLFAAVDLHGLVHRDQQLAQFILQGFVECVGVHQLFAAHLVGEGLDDYIGGFHAYIRHQQLGFDFFKDFVVDLLGAHQQVRQAFAQPLAGLAHALLHAGPEVALVVVYLGAGFVGRGCCCGSRCRLRCGCCWRRG